MGTGGLSAASATADGTDEQDRSHVERKREGPVRQCLTNVLEALITALHDRSTTSREGHGGWGRAPILTRTCRTATRLLTGAVRHVTAHREALLPDRMGRIQLLSRQLPVLSGTTAGGQDGESDPDRAERRLIRLRRQARLKVALLGRSRGELTSKIHLAADRRCRLMTLFLTAGQAAETASSSPSKVRVRLPVGPPAPGRPA